MIRIYFRHKKPTLWRQPFAPLLVFLCTQLHCAPKSTAITHAPSPSASDSSIAHTSKSLGNADETDPLRSHDKGLPHSNKMEGPAPVAKPPPRVGLAGGLAALEASEYETAHIELTKASQTAAEKGQALVGLARLAFETGRYSDAIRIADQASSLGRDSKVAAIPIKAKTLARQGKLEEAVKACEAIKGEPGARQARLVLGETLLRMGKPNEASAMLTTLIDDFNNKTITVRDGEGMALVGRAAHLLRSKRDANEAYDDAERAGNKAPEFLLWRAELFLEAYNLGRSEEVVREALKTAPNLAQAHVLMARVKLEQTLDFEVAEQEIQRALAVNKFLPNAFFVRAGISLRDMEIDEADKAMNEGLAVDPKDLELLSLKAAGRFLADDKPGFVLATHAVLSLNPEYSRTYQIIGEYADWEHRYDQIVDMMKEAIKIDPDDGRNWVNLGLNQIRLGDETTGVSSLDRGFRKDKFNVRAYNTLNLYERDIPQQYESADHGIFHIRYPKNEKKILERYVPLLLDEAWADMTKRYGFTPQGPIGIELYSNREHFSVRTSGLPNVGIQGVCFGKTLAAISPKAEPFNWGNVLWHEVSHVFAIQLSKNHVPRWFTEGLSEYETIARRPEWQREEDLALYVTLRENRVPAVERMNRAFTHADNANDVTVAYYASSQIAVFLVEKFGLPKLVTALRAWGEGKRTADVIQSSLGLSTDELDKQFHTWLDQHLIRYKNQYVPDLRTKALPTAEKNAALSPDNARAQVDLALALLNTGNAERALSVLDAAKRIDPMNPDVHFIRAKMLLGRKNIPLAKQEIEAMISNKNDGYMLRMMLADIAETENDQAKANAQWEAAARFDPTQAEPLRALVDKAHKAGDAERELRFLRALAQVDQHDRRVWRRLLARLVEKGVWDEAKKVGESSIYVDVHGAETHTLYAQALLGGKEPDRAIFEAESALLCDKIKTDIASRANLVIAKSYLQKGNVEKAKAARGEALRQDPSNEEAKTLVIPLSLCPRKKHSVTAICMILSRFFEDHQQNALLKQCSIATIAAQRAPFRL